MKTPAPESNEYKDGGGKQTIFVVRVRSVAISSYFFAL